MRLSELVDDYLSNPPAGFMLERKAVERCLKNAVRRYSGYAQLSAVELGEDELHSAVDASSLIDGAQDFDLNLSEYALIQPLFQLYVELENAISLEASRGLGVEVFGRTTSEINQDILQWEQSLPKAAFMEPVVSI